MRQVSEAASDGEGGPASAAQQAADQDGAASGRAGHPAASGAAAGGAARGQRGLQGHARPYAAHARLHDRQRGAWLQDGRHLPQGEGGGVGVGVSGGGGGVCVCV